MPKVNLIQGKTPAEIVEKGIKALGELNSMLPPKANVLIAIDLPIPEHNPVSINPDTLIALINLLNKQDITKITMIPATNPKINPIQTLEILGLDIILQQKGVEVLTTDTKDILSILDQYNFFIVIAQIRTHPIWNITTCSPLLSLLHPDVHEKSKDAQKDEGWIKRSLELCEKILFRKIPQLIINDGFYILEGNGPNFGLSSSCNRMEIMVIADDFYAGEYYTYKLFNLKPEEQKFIQFFQTQKTIPQDLSQIDLIEGIPIEKPISIKLPETNLNKIKIPGLELRIGEINEETRYALQELLYHLETLFYKEGNNLGQWFIMAGNVPPSAPKMGKIILFGDSAISSTKDFEFRTKLVMKDVLSPQELQKEISLQDGIIREKIDKQKSEFETALSQIEEKVDIFEKEEIKLSTEKKYELRTNKMKHQHKLKQIRLTFKQEILKCENLVPKISLNKEILEIPGNPPQVLDALFQIAHFWTPHHIPLLVLLIETMKNYYNFTEFDKKQFKQEWKRRENALKLMLKEQNKPLLLQRKMQIQKLKVDLKAKIDETKIEFTQLMQKTKDLYHKKENDFKARKKVHDRDIIEQHKAAKKQSISSQNNSPPNSAVPAPINNEPEKKEGI